MTAKPPPSPRKRSYTIPCSSTFRAAIGDLADRRRVNAADLARSVVLMVAPSPTPVVPPPMTGRP